MNSSPRTQDVAEAICAETEAIRNSRESAEAFLSLTKRLRKIRDQYRREGCHHEADKKDMEARFYITQARQWADNLHYRRMGLR